MIISKDFKSYASNPKFFKTSNEFDTWITKYEQGTLGYKQIYFEPLKMMEGKEGNTVWTIDECMRRGNNIGVFCEVEKFVRYADKITMIVLNDFNREFKEIKDIEEFKKNIKELFDRDSSEKTESYTAYIYKRRK